MKLYTREISHCFDCPNLDVSTIEKPTGIGFLYGCHLLDDLIDPAKHKIDPRCPLPTTDEVVIL